MMPRFKTGLLILVFSTSCRAGYLENLHVIFPERVRFARRGLTQKETVGEVALETEIPGRCHANVTAWAAAVDSHARKNGKLDQEGLHFFCHASNRAPTRSGHRRNLASDLMYGKERISTYFFLCTHLSLHLPAHDRRPTSFLGAPKLNYSSHGAASALVALTQKRNPEEAVGSSRGWGASHAPGRLSLLYTVAQ